MTPADPLSRIPSTRVCRVSFFGGERLVGGKTE